MLGVSELRLTVISEVRWKGIGELQHEKDKPTYSGGDEYERGVRVKSQEAVGCHYGYWAISG